MYLGIYCALAAAAFTVGAVAYRRHTAIHTNEANTHSSGDTLTLAERRKRAMTRRKSLDAATSGGVTDSDGDSSGDVLGDTEYPWRESVDVSFRDVGGMDQVIEEIRVDVVLPVRRASQALSLGVSPPNIVFHGPPGTGKTMLARAVAGELGVPSVELSASHVQSKWINESAENVRALFEEAETIAEQAGGAVVFIDELDSVLKHRNGDVNTHEEDRKVVNEFLTHLERVADSNVVFLGATNRMGALDDAAVRSGRIDKKIHVSEPGVETRRGVLNVELRDRPNDVSEEVVCRVTMESEGLVCSDLVRVVDEAAKLALRRDGRVITDADLERAHARVSSVSERTSHRR